MVVQFKQGDTMRPGINQLPGWAILLLLFGLFLLGSLADALITKGFTQ